MKRKLLTFALLALGLGGNAQTFSDNFDSYTAGNFLCQSNSAWKTWANTPGGADDVKINNTKAKSGSNSLYFSSITGGPADIVLPFGGQYNTGNFSLNFELFVETGKKGYINLQEKSTVGQGWSVDLNFDSLGFFNLVNTLDGALLSGAYQQNSWVKVTLNIDLNTNTWELLLNNVSQGAFQNSYRQIASANFYAMAGSSFYIDDVSYTYVANASQPLNGSVTLIDGMEGRLAGQSVFPSIEIRNLGSTSLTSAEVSVTYGVNTKNKSVSGLNIATGGTSRIQFDESFKLQPGSMSVVATLIKINGINDTVTSDNIKSININPVVPAKGKMVVVEEATGTWCSWCPRGAVWMHNMETWYPGYFLGIAVHNNDPMENANYDGGLGTLIGGYPSCVVDRGADIDPSAMEQDFYDRIVIAPKATMKNGAQFNASTRVLKASITTKFAESISGNWKLAFVLIEDSVTGTGNGWNQANSYAGGGRGPMGGYESKPNPVPASQMVYDHVGRIIYPNFNGLANAFGSTVNVNDSFTHNFEVTIDPSWEINELKIGALLIEPNGRINNGSLIGLEEAQANGFVNGQIVAS